MFIFLSFYCRALFAGSQKLFGILITVGEAIAYVVSGMYVHAPNAKKRKIQFILNVGSYSSSICLLLFLSI